MGLVPTRFFITAGKAASGISELNAFDVALIEAGIAEQNLLAVSSVIPIGAERQELTEMEMGAVTHCVMSQMRGRDGEVIAAGIAYAYRKDGRGGYVAEGHLHGSATDLDRELRDKMREMARIRGVELNEVSTLTEELRVPEGRFGCCVVALVFTEYR
ncbi:MAG: pyruvoyl-dependent arginine decarboxylase [Euryarchaeota archaeon]|nr:pyruvoyl-dependent arginine decarboxylase [Euryarchaeota archaeon]